MKEAAANSAYLVSDEKRMLGNYEITQSIYIGDKEVVFGVDKAEQYPFLVCCCDYHNPLGAAWAQDAVASDDYLEAMQIFVDRVQAQIDRTKEELSQYPFDKTVFTKAHCIPDNRNSSIVGKVVVIDAEPKRYEYQHPAYQLVLADGGNGWQGQRRVWHLPCHRRKSQMGKVRCSGRNQARIYARLGKGSTCED